MTDPKLNELPADARGDFERSREAALSEEERARARSRSRAGLSVNDTIAADANLSVGARGVDVSGVSAGAGAGAGSTVTTPGPPGGSPAPNIVPGASGSGVTPLATSGLTQNPAPRADSSDAYEDLSYEELSARAYDCWCRRGQPYGSPEVDWELARQELLSERRPSQARTAAAV
jgi:hypothetical protein